MKYKGIKKLYYTISEVSEKLSIKPTVIRYWETEFKDLSPQKNRAGNRIYKEDDIDTVRLIHHYVHEKHLSLHDANELIQDLKKEHLYKRKVKELSAIPPEELVEDDNSQEEIVPPAELQSTGEEIITEDNEEDKLDHDIPFDEGFRIISKNEKLVTKPKPFMEVIPEHEQANEPAIQADIEFEIVSPTKETFMYPLDEQAEGEEDIEETQNASISLDTTPEPIPEPKIASDPEVKELLKKIAQNINDVIDILNE